jgi:hypothetical protein
MDRQDQASDSTKLGMILTAVQTWHVHNVGSELEPQVDPLQVNSRPAGSASESCRLWVQCNACSDPPVLCMSLAT